MPTITLQPDGTDGVDAPINNGSYADINFQNNTFASLGTVFAVGVSIYGRMLLSFDLSGIPTAATVATASLTMYSDGSGVTSGQSTFTCRRVTQTSWTESGVTWNRYNGTTAWTTAGGDVTSTNAVTAEAAGLDTSLAFTGLAAMVNDAIAAGATRLHLLLSGVESAGASNYFNAFTSDTTTPAERPLLSLVYAATPDAGWTARKRYAHWSAAR